MAGVVQLASGAFEVQWKRNGSTYYSGHNSSGANTYWTSSSSQDYTGALNPIDPDTKAEAGTAQREENSNISKLENYNTIEDKGSIDLLTNPDGFGYAMESSGRAIAIEFNNQHVGNNTWSGWEMLGADTNNGINEVVWSNGSSTWISKHDSNWNGVNGYYANPGSEAFTQLESSFEQDFNKDGLF